MSDFPVIEAPYPVKIGDVWEGRFEIETVENIDTEAEVATPVDIVADGDDWIITFKFGDEVAFEMSTDNGYLTLSDTNFINFALPAADTLTLPAVPIYGELKNTTTNKTMMGVKTLITTSPNV